jgi:hypothetical protein
LVLAIGLRRSLYEDADLAATRRFVMRQHRFKASTIRLDAIGVVLMSGQPASLTHIRAVG